MNAKFLPSTVCLFQGVYRTLSSPPRWHSSRGQGSEEASSRPQRLFQISCPSCSSPTGLPSIFLNLGKNTATKWALFNQLLYTLEVQPPFFRGWFPNHHYFSRGVSSSKRNHHLKNWLPGISRFMFFLGVKYNLFVPSRRLIENSPCGHNAWGHFHLHTSNWAMKTRKKPLLRSIILVGYYGFP